ncbi:MAG: sortase [Clostridia bacterium]|nr:sortase [Clostridia bacterium]
MSPRRKIANRMIAVGCVLLIAAVIWLLYNLNRDWDAKQASNAILEELDEAISESVYHDSMEDDSPEFPDDMDTINIDGVEYVGYITIPDLEVELPVTKTWSLDKLKISPCRYSGNVENNDLVICAHNYRSHFGRLRHLENGAAVRFKDVHGTVTLYRVVASEILQPTAIEDMTVSDADLTLFTCTYGGWTRYTVRCERVKK